MALSHLRHSTGERLSNIEPLSRLQLLTEDDVGAAFNGHVVALVSRPIYWKCMKCNSTNCSNYVSCESTGIVKRPALSITQPRVHPSDNSDHPCKTLSSNSVVLLAFSYEHPVDVGLRGEVQAASRIAQVREALKHEAIVAPSVKVESVFEGD